jgi:hypothetical protein
LKYHSRYYRQGTVNSATARAFDEVSYNLDYLQRKGIPRGPRGDHLQSLVLCCRRAVLEAVGGFELGGLTKKRWPPRLPCPRRSRPLVWRSSKSLSIRLLILSTPSGPTLPRVAGPG